ncbi:SDR family oxidoreductase [Microbulbifer sp. CAU 1566]|uniref:SDR family oxidoreductase n=1 Tax=Microbulbifer sp. CAU 1566 TaxID=2933269 RepID=UPI0020053213|nr:SDR family oxidoreductase [Microbulbifer sp. CAU 1566]MCK7599109.1 SDR family oxidoreductase [Microbulbifer sp. CAU 1566]
MKDQEKIALITGGSRGIGAATARLLAARGYNLCISYRARKSAADALLEEISRFDIRAIAVQADISSEADVERLFGTVDSALGPISALVNNAGMLLQQSRVEQMTAERINRVLHTNVTGTLLCCREAIKRMSTTFGGNGGAIVNVSSGAARSGSPNEYIDYAASKGAVDTLTIGLSKEVAQDGIRVNGVRPGLIDTEMHSDGGEPARIDRLKSNIPLGRGGQPQEVAGAIAWLLSDEASFTTGSFIDTTGGL